MRTAALSRWLLPASLALLSACTQTPHSVSVDSEDHNGCPLDLSRGQIVMINLRNNPTTGFHWEVQDAAAGVLRSLGPAVYSNPEDAGLVGSAGQSTWRYQAEKAGTGRLLMVYRRPWEEGVAPAKTFDCRVSVE